VIFAGPCVAGVAPAATTSSAARVRNREVMTAPG
jgi:hypothetical protein